MPAKQFHCEIANAGPGPMKLFKNQVTDGRWSGRLDPSTFASIIMPNETKQFQAQSDAFLQGTEGSVTFQTLAQDSDSPQHAEYLKISFDVPYVQLPSTQIVVVEVARYDPDAGKSSFEWQGRDTRKADSWYTVF